LGTYMSCNCCRHSCMPAARSAIGVNCPEKQVQVISFRV
jgi:hypothetical protein